MPTVMVSKSESIEREYKEKATRPAPYKVPSKKPSRLQQEPTLQAQYMYSRVYTCTLYMCTLLVAGSVHGKYVYSTLALGK